LIPNMFGMLLHVTLEFRADWETKMDMNVVGAKLRGEEQLLLVEVEEKESALLESPLRLGKDRFLGVLKVKSKAMAVLYTHMVSRSFVRDGIVTASLTLLGYDELRELLRDLLGLNARVLRVSKVVGEEPLTVRQEQVLVAALESGYFDYPRKVRLSELAKRLNISPSTLDEVLRRAERNVLLKYIQGR